jgi:hypothetical protein
MQNASTHKVASATGSISGIGEAVRAFLVLSRRPEMSKVKRSDPINYPHITEIGRCFALSGNLKSLVQPIATRA